MKTLRAVNNLLASVSMTLAMLIIFIMVAALFLSASTRFITGTGFAWFVELPPVLVSWLVFPLLGPLLKMGQHIKVDFLTPILSDKSKNLGEKSKKIYRLGDPLLIKVKKVDIVRRFLDFLPAD